MAVPWQAAGMGPPSRSESYGVLSMFPEFIAPQALRAPIDKFVGGLVAEYSDVLRAFTQPLLDLLIWIEQLVRQSPGAG